MVNNSSSLVCNLKSWTTAAAGGEFVVATVGAVGVALAKAAAVGGLGAAAPILLVRNVKAHYPQDMMMIIILEEKTIRS